MYSSKSIRCDKRFIIIRNNNTNSQVVLLSITEASPGGVSAKEAGERERERERERGREERARERERERGSP